MTLAGLIDTFKQSVAQANLLMELTPEYIIVCLAMTLVCSLIVFLAYRLFYRGPCYSQNFGVLLILTALVTGTIILTISANLVLSLGMVGALSIVRFRAAVKDPLDVGFLFWSVAIGITCGAGLYMFSLTGTLFIAVIYAILQLLRFGFRTYLVVVRCDKEAVDAVNQMLKKAHARVRSRSTYPEFTEVTASFRMMPKKKNLDAELLAIPKVTSATLVEYTGDI